MAEGPFMEQLDQVIESVLAGGTPAQKNHPAQAGAAIDARRQAVGLENPGDRRAADAMPEVLQGALDPRVPPGRIVFGHPHDQASDLRAPPAMACSRLPIGPLARNELVPPQERIGRDDRGDPRNAHSVRPRGEPAPLTVGQS